ncbi:MAG TPA: DinB family protein [Holophagaceae bacterium]|jgi:uncharacterized damage-inducible protein DinB|nr:DinB family protein [Holophagaceae bacterium]
MPGELSRFQAAFEIATAHTASVIAATPDRLWDAPQGNGKTLRGELLHVALVRESICRQLAQEPTTGAGAVFETTPWRGGTAELREGFRAHAERCRALLERVSEAGFHLPFTTPFGNRSSPFNYLLVLLLEEQHHRAQMTMALRLAGVEPPPYPGQAWVELGVEQE